MPPTKDAHENNPATLIQSVQRALHLVETLVSLGGTARVKELAFAARIPLATTYHLLRTLSHEGYLHKGPDGAFTLGSAWGSLTASNSISVALTHIRPTLRYLRDELNSAVYFAVFDAGEISILELIDSPKVDSLDLWVGIQDAAHATALGKAILSALSEDERQEYLSRHPLYDLTQHTITDPRLLAQQLRQAKLLAHDDEEYSSGVHCLGLPVVTQNTVGAVAILKRTDDTQFQFAEHTAQTLQRGVQRVSRALEFNRSA
jgi:DNA-binding IclR family transcriptional regulator